MQKKLAMLKHNSNEGGVIKSLVEQSGPQMLVVAGKKALPDEVLIHPSDYAVFSFKEI